MGGKHPITIFTDQAPAIANAVKQVFHNTTHRLCMWHLTQNAGKHLSHELSIEGFKKAFTKCVYGCQYEVEFEENWRKMITEYNLMEHVWLSRLYEICHKWCPAFNLDKFSAGIRSTQRSESTNSVFRRLSCKTMKLTHLVHHIQKVAERWRSREAKMDFRCKKGKPLHAARDSGILKQAAQVNTIKIFNEFKQEYYDTLHLMVKGFEIRDKCYIYVIQQETHTRQFIVYFNPTSPYQVACSCKKFESIGILCSHALKVLNLNLVTSIPFEYINKRWSKDVKKGEGVVEVVSLNNELQKPSVTLMRRKLMLKAYKSINHSVLDQEGIKIAEKHLAAWMNEIESHIYNIDFGGDGDSSSNSSDDTSEDVHKSLQSTKIRNPTKGRPIGESN